MTFAVTLHERNQLVRRQAVEVEVVQRRAVWVGVGVIGHGGLSSRPNDTHRSLKAASLRMIPGLTQNAQDLRLTTYQFLLTGQRR